MEPIAAHEAALDVALLVDVEPADESEVPRLRGDGRGDGVPPHAAGTGAGLSMGVQWRRALELVPEHARADGLLEVHEQPAPSLYDAALLANDLCCLKELATESRVVRT